MFCVKSNMVLNNLFFRYLIGLEQLSKIKNIQVNINLNLGAVVNMLIIMRKMNPRFIWWIQLGFRSHRTKGVVLDIIALILEVEVVRGALHHSYSFSVKALSSGTSK